MLDRLAAYCPIKDVNNDVETVRRQMKDYPIRWLGSTVVTDANGAPLTHVTTDDQKFQYALNQHHTMAITAWGNFLAMILRRAADNGLLTRDGLVASAVGELIDESTAETMGRSLEQMLVGDFEAALYTLLVRTERVLRGAARALGLVIFREPRRTARDMGLTRDSASCSMRFRIAYPKISVDILWCC